MQKSHRFLPHTSRNTDRHGLTYFYCEYGFGHRAAPSARALWAGIIRRCRWLLTLLLAIYPLSTAGAASVTLAWDANSPPVDGYRLFSRIAGEPYDYSNPAWQGTATTCTLDQLEGGKTYYMVVRAYLGTLESADSNEVQYTSPPNQAPIANAGADQTVTSGSTVILDGSASYDPDGSLVTYTWTQTSGQTCPLSGSDSAQADFTAPSVTTSTTLVFQLSVTDDQGLSAQDTCQVTVVPDSDGDGLSDTDETTLYHTDPYNADSDGDGVNDGDEIAAGTDPLAPPGTVNGDKIWVEAEDGNVDEPMQIDSDANASEGAYLWVPQGSGSLYSPSSTNGLANYTFTISVSGTYRIWGRVIAPSDSNNSFFVAMDGNAYTRWDTAVATSWTWDLINSYAAADPLVFELSAGTHNLSLMQREDGTKIDKLIITSDANYVPQGMGEGSTANTISIEAESGTITAPMLAQSDSVASSGAYIWVPQGSGSLYSPSSTNGLANYTFTIFVSGTYRIWGRVTAPSGSNNSFFVAVDDSAYTRWDTAVATSWTWDLINSYAAADPLLFELSAGTHNLSLMQREEGTKIDKLIITSDAAFTPQ
jgi:hypothetical protein